MLFLFDVIDTYACFVISQYTLETLENVKGINYYPIGQFLWKCSWPGM